MILERAADRSVIDASAVIQISGSALQVVSTGEVLHVINDVEDALDAMPVWAGAATSNHARPAASTL